MASASGSSLAKNAQVQKLNVTGDLQSRTAHSTEPIACLLARYSTPVTLPAGVITPVPWTDAITSPQFVSGGMVNSASGVTVPVSGYYAISVYAATADATNPTQFTGSFLVDGSVKSNHSNYFVRTNDTDILTQQLSLQMDYVLYVEAGQLIGLQLTNFSDGSVNTNGVHMIVRIL